LGDNGDMALARSILDHKAAQPAAVIIEQLGRAHRTRDEDDVRRQAAALRTLQPARKHAQQPVGKIVEVALALLPISVVLAQHAPPHGILNALDRGFSRKAAFDRLAKATVPSLVVRKHAIGFEYVAMLAGRR